MIADMEHELELLTRHITVLATVFENEPIGIVSLSRLTDYPQHRVRYSLRLLEEEGLIKPTENGAITTEQATEFIETFPARLDEVIATVETLKTGSDPLNA